MKLLIAEDDRTTRRLLQSYLKGWGHEATAAEDGAEAWRLFQGGEFEIVITDWTMPRMDGLELVRRIRSSESAGGVYILMMTATATRENLVQCTEAGADDLVSKPLDPGELRLRLRAGQRIAQLEQGVAAATASLEAGGDLDTVRRGLAQLLEQSRRASGAR